MNTLQFLLVSPVVKEVQRPLQVPLPFPLRAGEDNDEAVCFFCRTADKALLSAQVSSAACPSLRAVISLDEVKTVYKAYVDRRALLTAHTHFLCDARIMPHLYNLLGNVFSSKSRLPVISLFASASLTNHFLTRSSHLPSLPHPHSSCGSLTHSLTHSLPHYLLIHSLIHSLIHHSHYSLTSLTHSLARSPWMCPMPPRCPPRSRPPRRTATCASRETASPCASGSPPCPWIR
jgi:hypothetical protein